MSGPFSYATITQAKRRAKTKRGKRFLEAKEPKVRENPKATMFVRGPGQGVELTELMKDLVRSFIALFGGCRVVGCCFRRQFAVSRRLPAHTAVGDAPAPIADAADTSARAGVGRDAARSALAPSSTRR